MKIYEKLTKLQNELNAPKSQYNSFGKYNYRSCEDILTAVKPLLSKHKMSMQISDEIANVGSRYYITATVEITDTENKDEPHIYGKASAREEESKKGMDGSQITGTASSYARKYALNGIFAIDDSKDADTNEYKNQQNNAPTPKTKKVLCPKCGADVKPIKGKDGNTRTPEQVVEGCGGMCLDCYKKKKAEEKNHE